MEREDKLGLQAVLNLVKDSQTCLDQALAELKLRKLGRFGWAMGSIGAARSAVKFSSAMIQGFMDLGDQPKQVGP